MYRACYLEEHLTDSDKVTMIGKSTQVLSYFLFLMPMADISKECKVRVCRSIGPRKLFQGCSRLRDVCKKCDEVSSRCVYEACEIISEGCEFDCVVI